LDGVSLLPKSFQSRINCYVRYVQVNVVSNYKDKYSDKLQATYNNYSIISALIIKYCCNLQGPKHGQTVCATQAVAQTI
jgi:hypothetical protein